MSGSYKTARQMADEFASEPSLAPIRAPRPIVNLFLPECISFNLSLLYQSSLILFTQTSLRRVSLVYNCHSPTSNAAQCACGGTNATQGVHCAT